MKEKIKIEWLHNYGLYISLFLCALNIAIVFITKSCRLDWLSWMAAGFALGCALYWKMQQNLLKLSNGWRDRAIERYQKQWADDWEERIKMQTEIAELKWEINKLKDGIN